LKQDGAGVTQMERNLESDPITELNGPVMDKSCHSICLHCHSELILNPPHYEVSNLPQYEVFISLPQYEVYKIALPQNDVFATVLLQLEVFQIAPVNCLIE
jgi:hypothetical protein